MSQENKNSKLSGPEKGDSPRKGPKFSIYWVYGIIAVILLSAQFTNFAPDSVMR